MTPADTLEFAHGLTARIYHDPDVENPLSCDDALRVVILHRRYIDPSNGACGQTPDEVAAWERENAAEWFTIIVATYAGTENCERLASHTQAELHQRLFPDVMVIGYPEPDRPGTFRSYAVLVGREKQSDDLEDELARLRAIDDWQGGKPAPFVSARIVAHPNPIGG